MIVIQVPVADLIPYVNNSRTHDDKQVDQIAASIREFGFTNPILIDEHHSIIAGHGRLQAARKLKLIEVPCIVLDGLTEAQKKAYVIADNKLALNASWDLDLLRVEIEALQELDFDVSLIGFDADELAKIILNDEFKELKNEEYNEVFNIIIECKNEEEQEKMFNKLDAEGYKCRVQSL